jgi:hypothetical protein
MGTTIICSVELHAYLPQGLPLGMSRFCLGLPSLLAVARRTLHRSYSTQYSNQQQTRNVLDVLEVRTLFSHFSPLKSLLLHVSSFSTLPFSRFILLGTTAF